ncbi:hypothetical protein CCAND95_40040 [Capnocytophaga canis]|uniref:Uncharacterized protein n=1 Tax=Capnocytophaga canis TaxID=1848903 RepID=A0A0B7HXI6_9FLAO|nr:hypothetical protein CCAND38_150038 [Capnocytophaga canis]CEN44406.1 hypothetical protein CCAND95_40040 [Capnocytophaga canis]
MNYLKIETNSHNGMENCLLEIVKIWYCDTTFGNVTDLFSVFYDKSTPTYKKIWLCCKKYDDIRK